MKTVAKLSVMILLAGLASSCASSKGQTDIVRMIAAAKTPADHEAIAEYYDQQATEAERSGHLHEAMAQQYRDMRSHPRSDSPGHCEKIAQYYEGIAQQDSQLAATHRALAQQGH